MNVNKKQTILCTNCGKQGHITKNCLEPITSYGILLFRHKIGTLETHSNKILSEKGDLEVLLICRKDTLGFIEIMRGKYSIYDHDYIKKHIAVMTIEEQGRLIQEPFQELWEGLWGKPIEGSNAYKHERETSREKLEHLVSSGVLQKLIEEVNENYSEAEWGFPKGRRDLFETDYMCAIRELFEETGIHENDIHILTNVEPLVESFLGSNGIRYIHKYFIGFISEKKDLEDPAKNEMMQREIGCLEWFTIPQAYEKIRPYNIEKRNILMRAEEILRNYCPLFIPLEIDGRRGRKEFDDRRVVGKVGHRRRF
jgi:8-oxo-dGTP pyrophosphatase MutT (NUDIX family)